MPSPFLIIVQPSALVPEVHGRVWNSGGKYLYLFAGRRKSSIVSGCFDTISIPQLSQHWMGWQSAAHVHNVLHAHSVLHVQYSWGAQWIFGGEIPPIAPPPPPPPPPTPPPPPPPPTHTHNEHLHWYALYKGVDKGGAKGAEAPSFWGSFYLIILLYILFWGEDIQLFTYMHLTTSLSLHSYKLVYTPVVYVYMREWPCSNVKVIKVQVTAIVLHNSIWPLYQKK